MKILFIYSISRVYNTLDKPLNDMIGFQSGISYISSLLKRENHETKLLVLTEKTRRSFIEKYIRDFRPRLIGFTSVATEYPVISNAAKFIKQKFPNICQIIGGPHASLNPEQAIADSFDAVCIGEGEYPVLELVQTLDKGIAPAQIKNLWLKSDDSIERNPTRSFLPDLDHLPFPDRSMWRPFVEKPDEIQVVFLGRGCPFNCSYCCNHALRKLADGDYVRFRSVKNIIDEVRELTSEVESLKEIYFEIETLGANLKFALDLCDGLITFNKEINNKLSYGVNLRVVPNKDFSELFRALKKANFSYVNIGLESGCEKIRKNVLRRQYSNEDIIKASRCAQEFGLSVNLYVMVGLPGETEQDFLETVHCVRECRPNDARLSIFYPYPGTDLYQLCKERGYLDEKGGPKMERRVAVLDLPEFSKKEIARQYDWFYYNVYRGRLPNLRLLLQTLSTKIMSKPYLLNFERALRKSGVYSLAKRLIS